MANNLFALLDTVVDEDTFIEFLSALEADWNDEREKEKVKPSAKFGPGANGWENGTIGNFLEAAGRWAIDSKDGLEFYRKPSNTWRRAADILYMGKIYE